MPEEVDPSPGGLTKVLQVIVGAVLIIGGLTLLVGAFKLLQVVLAWSP